MGCLVNARSPAAVVAGNTETSSRITDVVMAAFGQAVARARPGSRDDEQHDVRDEHVDVLRDDRRRSGGQPGADGPSGVHVAMSNALNTPVEALELAYPLRVERYALRLGSGGEGRQRGGDGVVREIRALEPCRLSVLGDRRRHAPAGADGAAAGARGPTLVNGVEIPGKETRGSRPATWCAPRPRVAAVTAGPRSARSAKYAGSMCRNIRTLHNFEPPATDEEVDAAALQYVRKIAGMTKPSQANADAFARAVDAVAHASRHLLAELVTSAAPRDREVEAKRARARAAARFGTG